jgi:hypothetical protein
MQAELNLISRLEADADEWRKADLHTKRTSTVEHPALASQANLNQAWADYYARRANALRRRFWFEYPHPLHSYAPAGPPPHAVAIQPDRHDYNRLLREAAQLRQDAADPNFPVETQARMKELAKMKEAQAARILEGLQP